MGIVPTFTYGSLDLTAPPFAVEFGTDLGAPESVTQVMASLLADGEIETETRRSNRTLVIPILIDDSDMQALADAELALVAEADRFRNTLTVDPGDGYGPATVFDTFQGRAVFNRVDEQEQAGVRRWTLTLRALPHGRSTTKITDSAGTPPSSGGTVVYAAESTSGWSKWAYTGGAAAVVDSTTFAQGTGSIRVEAGAGGDGTTSYGNQVTSGYNSDQVTGLSISTGTGGYLSLRIKTEFTETMYDNYGSQLTSGLQTLSIQVPGATGGSVWIDVATFTAVETTAAGWTRYVWPVAAGMTVTGFKFLVRQYKTGWGWGMPDVWYDDFELLPSATTDNQIVKVLDIKGSARTPGSLHIAAPSDSVPLGQVLTVTVPTSEIQPGFQPDVRRWVVSGSTTADTTALHGSYYTTSLVCDLPVSMLAPGPYTLVALVSAGATCSVTAQLRIGGTDVGPASTASSSLPSTPSGWFFQSLGTIYLPPLPMQNADSTAKVRVTLSGFRIADAYVIPQAADFSIVDCGTSTATGPTASSHLWLDSPDPAQPQGGWWRGAVAARGLARSAWPDVKKPAQHSFKPGSLTAFVVSTGAQGPTLTLEYFPSFHTNANL